MQPEQADDLRLGVNNSLQHLKPQHEPKRLIRRCFVLALFLHRRQSWQR